MTGCLFCQLCTPSGGDRYPVLRVRWLADQHGLQLLVESLYAAAQARDQRWQWSESDGNWLGLKTQQEIQGSHRRVLLFQIRSQLTRPLEIQPSTQNDMSGKKTVATLLSMLSKQLQITEWKCCRIKTLPLLFGYKQTFFFVPPQFGSKTKI